MYCCRVYGLSLLGVGGLWNFRVVLEAVTIGRLHVSVLLPLGAPLSIVAVLAFLVIVVVTVSPALDVLVTEPRLPSASAAAAL